LNSPEWTVLDDLAVDDGQIRSLKLFLRISARLFRAVSENDVGLAQQHLNESLQFFMPQQIRQIPRVVIITSNDEDLPCWFAAIDTELAATMGNDPPNIPLVMMTMVKMSHML
jgi:hypothetical protein